MKKLLFAFAAMIVWTACGNKQAAVPTEGNEASDKVAFEVAKNYFFKNDQEIPASPKITTAEEFGKLFGMATTIGEDGKPTEIDFTKQFVLAIVLPVTNVTPAWHWNKKHWSDVYYEQVDDAFVQEWIKESYQLVASKLPKAIRQKYIKQNTN